MRNLYFAKRRRLDVQLCPAHPSIARTPSAPPATAVFDNFQLSHSGVKATVQHETKVTVGSVLDLRFKNPRLPP